MEREFVEALRGLVREKGNLRRVAREADVPYWSLYRALREGKSPRLSVIEKLVAAYPDLRAVFFAGAIPDKHGDVP